MDLLKLAMSASSLPKKEITKQNVTKPVSIQYQTGFDNLAGEFDDVLKNLGKNRVFLRSIRNEPAVFSALDNRRDFVCSSSFELDCTTQQLSRFLESHLRPQLFDIAASGWDMIPMGASVVGFNYDYLDDGNIGIVRHLLMPLENYKVRESGVWQGKVDGEEQDLNPLQYVVSVRYPTYENQKGDPLLSKLFRTAEFRKNTAFFWVKWLERFGAPLLVGSTETNQTFVGSDGVETNELKELSKALSIAMNAKNIALNSGQTISAIEPAGNGDHFKLAYDTFKTEIYDLVLGSGGTIDTANNNRASGRTAESTLDQKINADLRLIIPYLQKVVDNLIAINNEFGKGFGNAKCTVKLKTAEDIKTELAGRDVLLVQAGANLTAKYFQDAYNLKPEYVTDKQQEPLQGETQQSLTLARKNNFTAEQQVIEDLGDELLDLGHQPISPELILKKIQTANSPEQAKKLLLSLLPQKNTPFEESINDAAIVARMLGYAHLDATIKELDNANSN